MSIFKTIGRLLGINKKPVTDYALSEAQKAVAALKQTTVGQAVAANIKTIESTSMTGSEKFAKVVADTAPLIVDLANGAGRKVILKDVEDIARQLVQDVFNDVMSKNAGGVARLILSLFGLR
ncbi:MAG TPA: hypothetical protein VF638_03015 [Sphingomonas sp.]|jgi:hypothetical protein